LVTNLKKIDKSGNGAVSENAEALRQHPHGRGFGNVGRLLN
jgi:hypothetical protein